MFGSLAFVNKYSNSKTIFQASSHRSSFFDPVSAAQTTTQFIRASDKMFEVGSKETVYLHSEWMAEVADYEMNSSPRTGSFKRAKCDFERLLQERKFQ